MRSNGLPKKIGNANTGRGDIQWRYWCGILHKKCAMLIMKS